MAAAPATTPRRPRGASAALSPAAQAKAERKRLQRHQVATGAGVGTTRSRTRFMLLASVFVLTLFAAQLVKIQGFDAEPLALAAQQGREVKVVVPAQRGAILDASGTPLAVTADRFDITADPSAVPEYTKKVDGKRTKVGIDGAAADIAAATEQDAGALAAAIKGGKGRFMYLVKDVSPEVWRAVRKLGIPGIYAEPTTRREYPRAAAVAPVVGYLGQSSQPAAGIELLADSTLRGQNGSMSYERGAGGQRLPSGASDDTPATRGHDVQLTVDADLSFYAANVLAQQVQASQALSGTALVMEVGTGDIKAAVSYPAFDPATVATSKSATLENHVFTDVYEPGSTGKVITMAALLDTGVAQDDTRVVVPDNIRRSGNTFRDSHRHPVQYLTLSGVLAESSNVGTILLGENLPKETQEKYMRDFGLGAPSGVGFPGESPGLLAPAARWEALQRFTVMFGQGVSSTAIQQASVFQTVANGGVRREPRIVAGSVVDGRLVTKDAPEGRRVIKEDTARHLSLAMERVVSKDGTAPHAAVANYRVAGKTSTAQRYDPALKKYNGETASFIGFAPASAPRYVVAVTVQRPTVGSVYGGDVAAPPFSKIMAYVLKKYDVPPDASSSAPTALVKYDPAATPPQVQDGRPATGLGTAPGATATEARREENR